MGKVMLKVVVVLVVMMYIMEEQNLCWSHSQIRTRMTTEFSVGNSRSFSCLAYTIY